MKHLFPLIPLAANVQTIAVVLTVNCLCIAAYTAAIALTIKVIV